MSHQIRLRLLRRLSASALFVAAIAAGPAIGRAANFGINFSGDYGNWGPHYVNQVGQYGSGPYPSAFGVAAANWYEPGAIANTFQLPSAPSSVNFQPTSMGAGSVDISWVSFQGWTGTPGYTGSAYGFANANHYETVDVNPADGQPDIYGPEGGWQQGYYVNGPIAATNGIPPSGEYAVLSGFLFATAEGEYLGIENPWPARDIVVTIKGLGSIASGYSVKLLASAQNGNPVTEVQGFTSATVSDNAAHSQTIDFTLLPDRPDYWSPADALDNDADPNTFNPYQSVAGQATTTTTFTGDELTIRLSGANEYFDNNGDMRRTTLAGVIIEYDSIAAHPGDFDSDGDVDGADFVAWQTNFPKANGATLAQGDADGDGDVDGADFVVWQTNFPFTPGPGSSPVPEPNSIVLSMLAALAALAYRRWS
jgi:hypothetical protein